MAAMRQAPWASHLVAACDLPDLTAEAVRWLLSTRSPGVWATLPRLPGRTGVEPLLAHYDFRARTILEDLAAAGRFSPSLAAEHPKVISPEPPPALAPAWANVNTPEDLARRLTGADDGPQD
jgi:molybdopterin-guanine dinucleotide biosynthesis protein A